MTPTQTRRAAWAPGTPPDRRATRRAVRRSRKGAAVVEFAVIAPIFFIIVLGIIEMGRAVMASQILVNASREGSRKAALTDMTVAEVQTWVDDYLESVGFPDGAATVTISHQSTPGGPFTPTADLTTVPPDSAVEVRVSVPFSQISWLPPSAYMPATLEGATIMRKETY